MKYILFCVYFLYLFPDLPAQENLLHITGAYYYSESATPGVDIIAVVVEGNLNLIGDPDDLIFVDADHNKSAGYSIDDCSFLSPDGKEVWTNLPEGFNNKMVHVVFIVGVQKNIKRIKIEFDGKDISDACTIEGNYPLLPPVNQRINHIK